MPHCTHLHQSLKASHHNHHKRGRNHCLDVEPQLNKISERENKAHALMKERHRREPQVNIPPLNNPILILILILTSPSPNCHPFEATVLARKPKKQQSDRQPATIDCSHVMPPSPYLSTNIFSFIDISRFFFSGLGFCFASTVHCVQPRSDSRR